MDVDVDLEWVKKDVNNVSECYVEFILRIHYLVIIIIPCNNDTLMQGNALMHQYSHDSPDEGDDGNQDTRYAL